MVHGPVREVVRGPGPLDWSSDRGSVFSGHPGCHVIRVSGGPQHSN